MDSFTDSIGAISICWTVLRRCSEKFHTVDCIPQGCERGCIPSQVRDRDLARGYLMVPSNLVDVSDELHTPDPADDSAGGDFFEENYGGGNSSLDRGSQYLDISLATLDQMITQHSLLLSRYFSCTANIRADEAGRWIAEMTARAA
ncbi:hypothetical protein ACFZ8E_11595 [Methylobacterium sp. HMF5984]|uniref:hypothetical protein n=1 Tax=Methylobacterium sp. HMF5984 TaxID=3367370 RepID=UPI003853C57A